MSELSFLLDLLINEKLSKPVKVKILARVKEIEAKPTVNHITPMIAQVPMPPVVHGQSPSTIAAMARHAAEGATVNIAPPVGGPIITSPVVAIALNERNQHINQALSGKPEPGRTSPRKF